MSAKHPIHLKDLEAAKEALIGRSGFEMTWRLNWAVKDISEHTVYLDILKNGVVYTYTGIHWGDELEAFQKWLAENRVTHER